MSVYKVPFLISVSVYTGFFLGVQEICTLLHIKYCLERHPLVCPPQQDVDGSSMSLSCQAARLPKVVALGGGLGFRGLGYNKFKTAVPLLQHGSWVSVFLNPSKTLNSIESYVDPLGMCPIRGPFHILLALM